MHLETYQYLSLPTDFAEEPNFHNILVSWLVKNEVLLGALIAINKEGGFQKEDADILGILVNNITVAREFGF